MSFKTERKVGKSTYVYEVTGYRDRVKQHRKYLGVKGGKAVNMTAFGETADNSAMYTGNHTSVNLGMPSSSAITVLITENGRRQTRSAIPMDGTIWRM